MRADHPLYPGAPTGTPSLETDMLPMPPNTRPPKSESATGFRLIENLQDPELPPMLSPTRYITLLDMDVETLARNVGVSVSAITNTPGAASIQSHLKDNLRVIKAAYDVSGADLVKSLRWFRAEQLPAFGQRTAEQAVSAGQVDDVIRLIDSLHGGAAG